MAAALLGTRRQRGRPGKLLAMTVTMHAFSAAVPLFLVFLMTIPVQHHVLPRETRTSDTWARQSAIADSADATAAANATLPQYARDAVSGERLASRTASGSLNVAAIVPEYRRARAGRARQSTTRSCRPAATTCSSPTRPARSASSRCTRPLSGGCTRTTPRYVAMYERDWQGRRIDDLARAGVDFRLVPAASGCRGTSTRAEGRGRLSVVRNRSGALSHRHGSAREHDWQSIEMRSYPPTSSTIS